MRALVIALASPSCWGREAYLSLAFDNLTETERPILELRAKIGYDSLFEVIERSNDRAVARRRRSRGTLAQQ